MKKVSSGCNACLRWKMELLFGDVEKLFAGQLIIAQDVMEQNARNDLERQTIDFIFEREKERRENKKFVKEYMEKCPKNKEGLCVGNVNAIRSGCVKCMSENTFDVRNGEPEECTLEKRILEKKRNNAKNLAVKRCALNTDGDFCEYKGTFNYCANCSKEFRRER